MMLTLDQPRRQPATAQVPPWNMLAACAHCPGRPSWQRVTPIVRASSRSHSRTHMHTCARTSTPFVVAADEAMGLAVAGAMHTEPVVQAELVSGRRVRSQLHQCVSVSVRVCVCVCACERACVCRGGMRACAWSACVRAHSHLHHTRVHVGGVAVALSQRVGAIPNQPHTVPSRALPADAVSLLH